MNQSNNPSSFSPFSEFPLPGFRKKIPRYTDPEQIEKLKAAKVEFLGKTPATLGGKNHILVFRDPDGNFIEFIGPMK